MKNTLLRWVLAACAVLGSNGASAELSYTCDPSVSASACFALNTSIAGLYNSTFTNVNSDIYITFGTTGLGSTTQFQNFVTYAAYRSALIAAGGAGAVRAEAIASLPNTTPNGDIEVTTALGTALGLSGLTGIQANGSSCLVGSAGCFSAVITITNDPSTPLYFRTGPIPPDAYDFFTTVEHETDEVLGSGSCINTSGSLSNGCDGSEAAVDLYRFNGGQRVLLDGTAGAYFSFDSGVTNGANGFVYNTEANGEDYADFVSSCPDHVSVQDAEGCPGGAGLDITNDGGAEINILNAVGYDLRVQATDVPEPATLALLGLGLAGIAASRRKRSGQRSL